MQGSGHAPPRFAVAVLLAAVLGVFAGPARADETFTFAGHGYGHGVGMPQYGAEGYALAGGSYQQILSLYYPGTTFGTTPPTTPIRVLLQSGQPSVQISSATGLIAHDETSSANVALPSAAVVTQSSGTYSVSSPDGVPLAAGWAGPVLLSPAGASPVMLAGNALFGGSNRTYRGSIRVVLGTTGLAAINVLPLEDYLRGVVPSEMSSSWRPAALAAQAVAARSYALATGGPSSGLFDEYADTRSQAYGGVLAEKPETDAAIAATSGQVLTYAGKTAVTYFSSSSGGRTANVQEVFTNAQPTPYLVAVDDPYDAASPHHDWTLSLTGAGIAQALGYAGTLTAVSIDPFPSGRVRSLVLDGSAGQKVVPAGTARTALGLRSTWFTTGSAVIPVTPPAPKVALTLAHPKVRGRQVLLQGTAAASPVELQAARGASWSTLATSMPAPDGTVRFTRTLGETALYRLYQDLAATPAVRISIGSGLVLRRAATDFRARLFPVLARRAVALQRAGRNGWTWIARGSTDAKGRVVLTRCRLAAGVYRAHYAGDSIYRPSSSRSVRIGHATRRTLAWVPTDPLSASQWNTKAVGAFDSWPQIPVFTGEPVAVAVVDGGIDDRSPDLVRPDGTSVVSQTIDITHGSPSLVHGTAVAGIIAARANNGIGIAGLDQSVRIIDVRVVSADGTIDPRDEARGIQKAVDRGARVINLSLGGKRAPGMGDDEYSRAEQEAIDYAYSKGAVIVAATGNSQSPYRFASYPAGLPHVLGVSAVGPDGHTPRFSNRDGVYNDLAAPGFEILTTVPRELAASGSSKDAPAGEVVGP
ncbi:MAG: stage sporulation protein, partial [Gaiellales bacterium]|nr:stage sporulation protein [Gaiellales bacterium]